MARKITMYRIIELNTDAEKRKLILQEMTKLKHRQLNIRDLQQVHLELLKILNVANKDSDIFEDISKSLFIVSHYSQIANGMHILLESLYLCKLASFNNPYVRTKINKCIRVVGSYKVNKELINIVTTIFLIADRYLRLMNSKMDKDVFFKFIKTTIECDNFKHTSFYISLMIYMEECVDAPDVVLKDLFQNLEHFLKSEQIMKNYFHFIEWYFEHLEA